MKGRFFVLNIVGLLGLLIACGGSAPVAAPTGEATARPLTTTSALSTPLPRGKTGGEAGGLRIDIHSTDGGRNVLWDAEAKDWVFSYQPSVAVTVENTSDSQWSLEGYEFLAVLGNSGESETITKADVLTATEKTIRVANLLSEFIGGGEVRRYRLQLGSYADIEDLTLRVLWVGQTEPVLNVRLKPLFPPETWAVPPTPLPGLGGMDFIFTLYQGVEELGEKSMLLSQLKGKPIVLNFWGGLAPPSRSEMKSIQLFYEQFQGQITVLGIDVGQFTGLGNQQDARTLLRELEITYPAGFVTDSTVMKKYGILGMPTTVFLDSDGEIFHKWTGALNQSVLEELAVEIIKTENR